MGGDMPFPQVPVGNKDHTQAAVVIIGAGVSGMCTAIDLLKRNKCQNFIIVERSGGLGGTWRDNKYPGCCCDVWSHLYSYSFAQNPDWTREYPGQEEILDYLLRVAQKYGLFKYIRFNTSVDEAHWDDAEKNWKTSVTVSGTKDAEYGAKYTITSDFLVSAVGQLNVPSYPDIPGLKDYQGKLMHSARWDWSYDLKDKKIAIIGNGATAAQIIPELAKVAKQLTVHQRTPNWIVPRMDAPIPEWKRAMYRYIPPIRWRYRGDLMDFRESTFVAIVQPDSDMAAYFKTISKTMLETQLKDRPDLWDKLTPKYAIGCKRIIITDDYFPAFAQANVSLETGKISRFTEKGIEIEGQGETEYDLVVLATGFQSLQFMAPMRVTGSAGRSLNAIWDKGGRALYGMMVESLPNFAMLYGPNSNLGHNSIILMIEAQSRYINALVKEVIRARSEGKTLVIQVKKSRLEEYNRDVQAALAKSSFADPNCASWYKNEEGVITNNWSSTVVDYQKMLSKVDWGTEFDLSGNGAEGLGEGAVTKLGRVVEETLVSYRTMGLAALSVAAVAGAWAARNPGMIRWMR